MTTTDAVKVPQPRPATGKVKALEQTVLASPTKLVRVIGTSNLATLSGVQTVDSVALKLGDVVLLTAQTTTHQNRLWTVMQGTWIAPLIADHPEKLAAGTKVTAQEGTANAGKTYRLTTTGTIVLGTTALTWTLDGSSGSGTVTSVTGTSPVQVATGTTTPVISVDAATTTASGIVELATTAETITGSDTVRAVTPAGAAGTYQTLANIDTDSAMAANSDTKYASQKATKTANDLKIDKANGGKETLSAQATATGATTINMANGNVHKLTLTGNVTLTFSGATTGTGCSMTVYIAQDGTGSRTITWPTIKWPGGIAPTISTAINAIDIYTFFTMDGGTTWFGNQAGKGYA